MDDKDTSNIFWHNHDQVMMHHLKLLYLRGAFTDMTIKCEGKYFRCHRTMLSAGSLYFHKLLLQHQDNEPIFVLDITAEEVSCILSYIYTGEFNIHNSKLDDVLEVARWLEVEGLMADEPAYDLDDEDILIDTYPPSWEPIIQPIPADIIPWVPSTADSSSPQKSDVPIASDSLSNGQCLEESASNDQNAQSLDERPISRQSLEESPIHDQNSEERPPNDPNNEKRLLVDHGLEERLPNLPVSPSSEESHVENPPNDENFKESPTSDKNLKKMKSTSQDSETEPGFSHSKNNPNLCNTPDHPMVSEMDQVREAQKDKLFPSIERMRLPMKSISNSSSRSPSTSSDNQGPVLTQHDKETGRGTPIVSVISPSYSQRYHQCDKCDYKSRNCSDMTIHASSNCMLPLQCEKCHFKTIDVLEFQCHMEGHDELTNSQASFDVHPKRKRKLDERCTHNKQKRKKELSVFCHICHKGYTSLRRLNTHMKLHDGIKPFNCRLCPYAGAMRPTVVRHLRVKHGVSDSQDMNLLIAAT